MRVNQLLLSCIISLLISNINFAQDGKRRTATTRFGFKAGFNRSYIVGKETNGDKTGYIGGALYAGLFSETTFSPRCKFGQEILFSWTNDYHFVEIPLLVHYRINDRWSTFGGLRIDIVADNDEASLQSFQHLGVSAEAGVQFIFLKRFCAEFRHAGGLIPQVTDHMFDINNGRRNTTRVGVGFYFSR